MGFQIANNTSLATIDTANTNLDGSGSITEIFIAGGTYGSVINTIRIQSRTALTNPGMVRIFMKSGSAGVYKLLKEVAIPITSLLDPPYPAFGATVNMNLSLENDFRIGVSTHLANTFDISVFGIDITGFV